MAPSELSIVQITLESFVWGMNCKAVTFCVRWSSKMTSANMTDNDLSRMSDRDCLLVRSLVLSEEKGHRYRGWKNERN